MFFVAFSLVAVVARQLFVAINTYALPSSTGSCFYLFAPRTHTHGQGQEHTCFPQRSLLLEKLNLAFCNLTKKKAEEKRQQWGEREGVKEKNEARSKLCFLFSFDFFFAFFLLVWHVLSCLSFCFARVIFLSFSAQREIHLAHMTTTAAAVRQQQQLEEHKLQNGCQRNQKEKQGAGAEGAEGEGEVSRRRKSAE